MRRECKATKSIDGGSCSERVPCDGVIEGEAMTGGCGEPCSFVMQRPDPVEAAFRAGFSTAMNAWGHGTQGGDKYYEDEAWEKHSA